MPIAAQNYALRQNALTRNACTISRLIAAAISSRKLMRMESQAARARARRIMASAKEKPKSKSAQEWKMPFMCAITAMKKTYAF